MVARSDLTPAFLSLRVYAPDFLPASPTMRGAFEEFLLPGLTARGAKRTIKEYEHALARWEEYTSNPPVDRIDDEVIDAFRTRLIARKIKETTVGKIWGHLRPILRRCSARAANNPRGKALIALVPYFEPLKVPRTHPRNATLEEVDALYVAADAATWPVVPGVTPGAIWRAAIVCWWNLGPRCWDLWGDAPGRGWKWDDLKGARIKFWIQKTKNFHVLPCNRVVMAHLDSIRGDAPRQRIFPASLCQTTLYAHWAKIISRAGVEVPTVSDLTPHNLRKSCQTEFDELHMGMGDYFLDHRAEGVGGLHYRGLANKAARRAAELPQPGAFQAIFAAPSQQRTLF